MRILDELSKRGIRAWLMGNRVRVSPRSLLTEELKRMIIENRNSLIEELAELEEILPKPYFHRCGEIVIPFNSPRRYHWWAGGQSLKETMLEITQNECICQQNQHRKT